MREERPLISPVRRWLRLTAACGLLMTLYFVFPDSHRLPAGALVARGLVTLGVLGALGFLIARQLRLQLDEGGDRRVDGLVVSVFASVVVFSLSFYLLTSRNPAQVAGLHTRVDALYFTMSTLTTVGYGDIHAAGQAARVLVLIQMVFNIVFVTTAATLLSSRLRSVARDRAAARRSGSQDQGEATPEG